jgi:hypothetical protein
MSPAQILFDMHGLDLPEPRVGVEELTQKDKLLQVVDLRARRFRR